MKITQHAKKRLRQRTKGKTKRKGVLVRRAITHGICYSEAEGPCKKYIAHLYGRGGGRADNIRLLDDKVYIIQRHTLLTVLHLPERYIKEVERLVNKKRCYADNQFLRRFQTDDRSEQEAGHAQEERFCG